MKAKVFILELLCLCLNSKSFAQNGDNKRKIHGVIKNSESGNPLEFATAILIKEKDSTVIGTNISDQKGLFVFNEVPAGNYLFKFTFMGYLDTEKRLK